MSEALKDTPAFQVAEVWRLPTSLEPFLDWLDDSGLAQDTEDSLAAFMELPVAKKMPATLKDDLRREGWL